MPGRTTDILLIGHHIELLLRARREGRLVGVCSVAGAVDLDAARAEIAIDTPAPGRAQRRAA